MCFPRAWPFILQVIWGDPVFELLNGHRLSPRCLLESRLPARLLCRCGRFVDGLHVELHLPRAVAVPALPSRIWASESTLGVLAHDTRALRLADAAYGQVLTGGLRLLVVSLLLFLVPGV